MGYAEGGQRGTRERWTGKHRSGDRWTDRRPQRFQRDRKTLGGAGDTGG